MGGAARALRARSPRRRRGAPDFVRRLRRPRRPAATRPTLQPCPCPLLIRRPASASRRPHLPAAAPTGLPLVPAACHHAATRPTLQPCPCPLLIRRPASAPSRRPVQTPHSGPQGAPAQPGLRGGRRPPRYGRRRRPALRAVPPRKPAFPLEKTSFWCIIDTSKTKGGYRLA